MKKAPVPVLKSAPAKKKRGRPSSKVANGKQVVFKPIATTSNQGSTKKRGRPKKSVASSEAPVLSIPANDTTTTVAPTDSP